MSQTYSKNTLFAKLFHTSFKGVAGKKYCQKIYFTEICFQFFSGFAGKNQVLRMKIRKPQCDWID